MERAEAIKIIKTATVYTPEEMEALETLIPELKESEDEKIREWLTNLVENLGDAADEDAEKELEVMRPLALAYLEKQKELPFVKDVMLGYPGVYFYDGERMHFGGSPARRR